MVELVCQIEHAAVPARLDVFCYDGIDTGRFDSACFLHAGGRRQQVDAARAQRGQRVGGWQAELEAYDGGVNASSTASMSASSAKLL